MLVCVALTRGRVCASSLPTVTAIIQPRTLFSPKTEVTPSLLFSRKISKKLEILNPLKLKLGKKGGSGYLVQDAKGVGMKQGYDEFDVLLRKRA